MNTHIEIWNHFASIHEIQKNWVDLFDVNVDSIVNTKLIGTQNKRKILCRSKAMETLIIRECEKLVMDWKDNTEIYDGLIYIMGVELENGIAPLYIGKAEKYGRGDKNLSININGVTKDKSKFGRWGDNYAYHMGDLSAAAIGHDSKFVQPKYQDWANKLFESIPNDNVKLKCPVYFWAKAWNPKTDQSPWIEFGNTHLTFVEYLLIGLCSSAFPEILLNREGQNRK